MSLIGIVPFVLANLHVDKNWKVGCVRCKCLGCDVLVSTDLDYVQLWKKKPIHEIENDILATVHIGEVNPNAI